MFFDNIGFVMILSINNYNFFLNSDLERSRPGRGRKSGRTFAQRQKEERRRREAGPRTGELFDTCLFPEKQPSLNEF